MFSKLTLTNFKNIKVYGRTFMNRHIGIRNEEIAKMLSVCGVSSMDDLMSQSVNLKNFKIPIKSKNDMLRNIPSGITELQASHNLKSMLDKNKSHMSLLGMGYHNNITPFPIKRHLLENPKWYTAYTPYQAEISQGRLEAQYNFQTVIQELTGLPVSNASLLDEASTAAEVLNMCFHYKNKNKKKTFVVCSTLHPQSLEVLRTKAKILGVNLLEIDFKLWDSNINLLVNNDLDLDYDDVFGIMFQYPNTYGNIHIPSNIIEIFKKRDDVSITCSSDILSLLYIKEPKAIGADICFGSAQRLGVPLFYGGPHPAFLSCEKEYMRLIPGRIVGKSMDSFGKECYRLGLQTREQHIRKEKATSNICTSQSLLANVVGLYCYYNGKDGLQDIAYKIHMKAKLLEVLLQKIGLDNLNANYFDTLHLNHFKTPEIYEKLLEADIILRKENGFNLTITLDETISLEDIHRMVSIIYNIFDANIQMEEIVTEFYNLDIKNPQFNSYLRENNDFLNCPKFSQKKTETEFLRYIHQLTKKDYTLCEGMIPLGSCTMKLNATYQLEPLSWDSSQQYHPYVPFKYVKGYHKLIRGIGDLLKDITGFSNVSFQSNSGAMGEYSGLLCIRKYHQERGDSGRNICLIPKSAHGTNFASANLAGLQVKTYDDNLNMVEFRELVSKYNENLAALMVTYPGTNGIFQSDIREICDIIHDNGGLVYMDGANMNAQIGLVSPGWCGADVCHLNLHKTFCIPHGGGGPGMGPILCNDKLKDYLPTNIVQYPDLINSKSIGMITGSNWSSASLLTIPYLYILGMGKEGLIRATQTAILNANYLKDSLKDFYTIIDTNENGRVAHEFIIDTSEFREYNITEADIAKRMLDYSFHPPTMSWPRNKVLMFEPTESEGKEELDRLVRALISIRQEIEEIKKEGDLENNVLKNAPHSLDLLTNWPYSYSMGKAYYPLPELTQQKFWPTTNRIDDIQGDKKMLL